MQKCFYNTNLQTMRVLNQNLRVYSIYESIVIDSVCVSGITNFGIEIKNRSNSGTVIDVSIYGSPTGAEYYPIENNIFNDTIGPGQLKHVEFTLVSGFLRISVKTDADIDIDVYVHGNIT